MERYKYIYKVNITSRLCEVGSYITDRRLGGQGKNYNGS